MNIVDIQGKIEEYRKQAEAAQNEILQTVSVFNEAKKAVNDAQTLKLNLQIARNMAKDAKRAARTAKKTLGKIKKCRDFDKVTNLGADIATNFRMAEKAVTTIKNIQGK